MKYRIIEAYIGEEAHWDEVAITGVGTQLFDPEFVIETLTDESFAIWEAEDEKGRTMNQVFLREDDTFFSSKNALALTLIRIADRKRGPRSLNLKHSQVRRLMELITSIASDFDDTCAGNLEEVRKILRVDELTCVKPVEDTRPALTVEVAPKGAILGTERRINAVWTIRGYFTPEGKVFITSFSHEDEEGYKRERDLPTAFLDEEDEPEKRTVVGISIADRHCNFLDEYKKVEWKQYAVANPGFVFGYGA